MDVNQTRSLLRINGVPEDCTVEVITEFLTRAHYSEADIAQFLKECEAQKNGTPLVSERHSISATEYAPQAFVVSKPEPKKRHTMRIALALVVLILLGAGGYTAYAVYGVSPMQSLLGSTSASIKDEKFHMDFEMHTVASSTSDQLKLTMGLDADSTNQNLVKIRATPSLDSALFGGSLELRMIGESFYVKINDISFLGQSLPPQPAWYEGTRSDLEHSSLPGGASPINPDTLLAIGSTSPAQNIEKLFDDGTITAVGSPQLHFIQNKPVVTYHFAIDGAKLTAKQQRSATTSQISVISAPAMQYGPVEVTKDLLSGKLMSVDGMASSTSTSIFGAQKTTTYAYHLGYRAAPEVSIEKPDNAQPISTLQSTLLSSVEEGVASKTRSSGK